MIPLASLVLSLLSTGSPAPSPNVLDLHVEGVPREGESLELVVAGKAGVPLLVSADVVERREPGVPALLVAGTRPARAETLAALEASSGHAGSSRRWVGRIGDGGAWRERITAPAAGTVLCLRAFERGESGSVRLVEALELEIAPATGPASSNEALGIPTPGPSVGGRTPLPPGHGITPCALREDVPDAGFEDTNCDGIDGDRSRAVFVATTGAPGNDGTIDAPLASIQDAILLAQADPSRDHVYVSEGTYDGRVDLVDGVSVWGGYSAANDWQRSSTYVTRITGGTFSGDTIGVFSQGLATRVVLGDVEVATPEAPAGGHNYGILLQFSEDVRLEAVRVIAGPGGAGINGAAGTKGTNGSKGSDGSGSSGGSGGSGAYSGGAGGDGGTVLGGEDGSRGGGPNSTGGAGGGGGGFGSNASAGSFGRNGSNGGAGTVGANQGGIAGGFWSQGGNGGSGGSGGRGTGGGGGGGGGYVFFHHGGGGGGGGGGGWGGSGGAGGGEGGSSFALFLAATNVTLHACELTSGQGRDGGTGGAGGDRGGRGQGGSRATPADATTGGDGGYGGYGGYGGAGGGGGGGHSYALLADSLSDYAIETSLVLNASTAGAGGTGGNDGVPGLAALIREF